MSVVKWYCGLDEIFESERVILQRLCATIRNKKLLDIGIGGGRTTRELLKLSKNYTGIDYSSEFVRIVSNEYPDSNILQADARDLRLFKDESFDFILFSYNGIDYIPPEGRLRALSEIYRVLKPLGCFMFSTHNLNYKRLGKLPWRENSLSNPARLKSWLSAITHMPKHLVLRRHEIHNHEYAILNDSANGYSLLTYHIGIDEQTRQLRHCGFDNTEVYNLKGDRITHDRDYPWTYYLTRKPTAAI